MSGRSFNVIKAQGGNTALVPTGHRLKLVSYCIPLLRVMYCLLRSSATATLLCKAWKLDDLSHPHPRPRDARKFMPCGCALWDCESESYNYSEGRASAMVYGDRQWAALPGKSWHTRGCFARRGPRHTLVTGGAVLACSKRDSRFLLGERGILQFSRRSAPFVFVFGARGPGPSK